MPADTGVPGDVGVDGGAADGTVRDAHPGDGAAVDGGGDAGPGTASTFLSPTAGGARRTSTNYRLELFVAPAGTPAATSSTGYRLRLGAGALRNAR